MGPGPSGLGDGVGRALVVACEARTRRPPPCPGGSERWGQPLGFRSGLMPLRCSVTSKRCTDSGTFSRIPTGFWMETGRLIPRGIRKCQGSRKGQALWRCPDTRCRPPNPPPVHPGPIPATLHGAGKRTPDLASSRGPGPSPGLCGRPWVWLRVGSSES